MNHDTHTANHCVDYRLNKGDCNNEHSYQYCDATYRLRDSKIDCVAQNGGASKIDNNHVNAMHHNSQRHSSMNNSTGGDLHRRPATMFTGSGARRITTIDQHTNPFVYKIHMSLLRKIMIAIFTIFVAPVRLFILIALLLLSWSLATIGLCGLSVQDLNTKPLTGWRRMIQQLAARAMFGMFFFGSFHNVKITGRQATSKEAPILVLAPHSSFFDSISVVLFGPPSVLAKAETASLPLLGKLINFTQALYVWREDPNSRQNTIKTVIQRANSHEKWPQIIIFPEGTCTNRSCVLSFKPGSFYPGVPVQPVLIRYPNRFDTVTWTWEGPGALKLVWLTLCSFNTNVELEFLPVYVPTEEERNNPKFYAMNVRNVMAKALNLPTSDLTYDDCKLMTRARQMNVPHCDDIVEIERLREKIGLSVTNIEEQVVGSSLVHDTNCIISMPEFALRLQIQVDDPITAELFRIFDTNMCGEIDFREYLMCGLYLIKQSLPTIDLIESVSMMYDYCAKGRGFLTRTALHNILKQTMGSSVDESVDLFTQVDCGQSGFITIQKLRIYLQCKTEYANLFEIPTTAKKTATTPKPKTP